MDQFSNQIRHDEARDQLEQPEQEEYADVDVENFDFEAFLQGAQPLVALPSEPSNNRASFDRNEYEELLLNGLQEDPQERQLHYDKMFSPQAPQPLKAPSVPMDSQPQQEPAEPLVPIDIPPQPWVPIDPTFRPAEGILFHNLILNSFKSPIIPLRVIDEIEFPFSPRLQEALRRELEFQAEFYFEKPQEAQFVVPQANAWPYPAYPAAQPRVPAVPLAMPAASPAGPRENTKKAGNKRPENIKNFDPAEFYDPLPAKPAPWGIDPETGGANLFKYNEYGELDPNSSYTVRQMQDYLALHPLHSWNIPKQSGLTIWVQVAPADSSKRYGTKNSDKCRFECCPDPLRTIRKGDFRVAFDEQFAQRHNTDPFHNAGYVHLYCLEKFFDFPQMCKEFNVKPDTRKLREGKNKMAITRDHPSMGDIVLDFIENSKPWKFFGEAGETGNGLRPEQYYENTLCYLLTVEHLAKQPKHLQRVREARGGNSIDNHLNNLEVYLQGRREMERRSRTSAAKDKRKRKAENDDHEDSDEVLNEDVLSRSSTPPSKKTRRRL